MRVVINEKVFSLALCASELSETLGVDEDHPHHHLHHDERVMRSRSPPPHHLPPPPPPPPALTASAVGTHHHADLRQHYGGGGASNGGFSHAHHLHHHQQQTSSVLLNRSSSPAHDLGYHTLVARNSSAAPGGGLPVCWSPADLADLTLTPSPRYSHLTKKKKQPFFNLKRKRDEKISLNSLNRTGLPT